MAGIREGGRQMERVAESGTDDKRKRERKRDKDGDKGRVRARVVESRQVGVCWPGPSGAIDPGRPYIRDRKPELHASSPSPRSPPFLFSSKSLPTTIFSAQSTSTSQQYSPLSFSSILLWSRACQAPLQAAVNSSSIAETSCTRH